MGSQKSSESTSYSGSGQLWARPLAIKGAENVFAAYNKGAPVLDRAVSGTSGLANQLQGKFAASQGGAALGQGYLQDVLSGKYLNGNPHLDSIIGAASGDIRDAVNSQYSGAGRYGSAYHDGAVAKEIGNMASNLRYGDFNNQMGRMDQAAQVAQAANSGDAQQALAALGQQGQLPFTGQQALANSLAALFSGGTSKSVQYAPNPIWGAIGSGLGAAGAYFGAGGTLSEREAKTDIKKVGELADGLGLYEFRYKNDPDRQVFKGVMADEVEKLRPWALGERLPNGYRTVNYAAL